MIGGRIVPRKDGAKNVERAGTGSRLDDPVRVRRDDEVCKRLPQHVGDNYTKSPPNAVEDSHGKADWAIFAWGRRSRGDRPTAFGHAGRVTLPGM